LPFPYSDHASRPGVFRSNQVEISRRNLLLGASSFIALGGLGYLGSALDAVFSSAMAQSALLAPGPMGDMIQGSETAPITIVEYASLTCPHCRDFAAHTFPELKKRYIDTGKVRFIFREYALNDVDLLAIVIARCAPKERYFPLVETLYEKQDVWAVNNPVAPLMTIAKQAGFTDESFKACASNQQLIEGVKAQREAAGKLGVNSTPTLFINGEKHPGGMTIEEMEKVMQPYLKAG
jgi:protein-disulfide isomerase